MAQQKQDPAFFQGTDWFTHHPFVADAYDAMDRMMDLAAGLAEGEVRADSMDLQEKLEYFWHNSDDLATALLFAEADMLPASTDLFTMRWMMFEARLGTRLFQHRIEDAARTQKDIPADDIMFLVGRIKNALRGADA